MNSFNELKKLFPAKDKEFIGKVDSIDTGNNTSKVTLIGGANVVVRGTSVSVGGTCLVKDNSIINELPELSIINKEITWQL